MSDNDKMPDAIWICRYGVTTKEPDFIGWRTHNDAPNGVEVNRYVPADTRRRTELADALERTAPYVEDDDPAYNAYAITGAFRTLLIDALRWGL